MGRRTFTKEFKVEAVRLVRDRGVSIAQAARDLDLHENVIRKWLKDFDADPGQAFPGHGNMKPEQAEIERLKREVQKLKAKRDILKKATAYVCAEHSCAVTRRTTHDVLLHRAGGASSTRREAPGDLAGSINLRGARGLAQQILRVADAAAKGAITAG